MTAVVVVCQSFVTLPKDNVFCSDFSVTSINKYNKNEFCENIVKDMQLKPKSTVVRLQNIPPGLMLSSDE